MERNASIKQILETMDHSVVKKHLHIPISAYLLFVVGVTILELTTHLSHTHRSILFFLFIVLSLLFIFGGFLSGLVDKTYFKHIHSGTKIYFREIYFDKKDFRELQKIIDTGNYERLNSLHESSQYSAKLQLAYSADKSFCMVQAVKYIPFKFAELTEAKQLEYCQIIDLFHFVTTSIVFPVNQRIKYI